MIMKTMNSELKKVVSRVKTAQVQLQSLLKNKTWVEDARKYAERQGREVKKLFSADVGKVKNFLEKERKELEKFQKQIPGEVKKLRKFVTTQKKEFEKLLLKVRKTNGLKKTRPVASKKKTAGAKRTETSTGATA